MKLSRFNLRDLFWLILVAALALGWWMDRRRIAASHERVSSALRRVYQASLPGRPLADVIREQQLEKFEAWHMPNLPPGADGEVTYYLDEGNLRLTFAGDPATITSAAFDLSDQSAQQRFQAVGEGWSDWVQAHPE